MTVEHPPDHLSEEHFRLALLQSFLLFDVGQQLPALQVFHDDRHLHILEREAVVNLDYVFVI